MICIKVSLRPAAILSQPLRHARSSAALRAERCTSRVQDSDSDSRQDHLYVWDSFIRIFHWTIVVAFATAYVIEDPLMVHVWAGYVVGGLVIARVVWGFIGSPHARFSDFAYTPSSSLRYLRDLARLQAKRYVGHSPGGSAMVFALLVFLVATVVTGLIGRFLGRSRDGNHRRNWCARWKSCLAAFLVLRRDH
jgi:cytochrome b